MYGTLRKVIVHRPGLEHSRLTPANAEELLFDDVLWVSEAKREHDAFCEAMRERGVEVFEIETLLAEAIAVPQAKEWIASHILNEREVGIGASDRGRAWMAGGGRGGVRAGRRDAHAERDAIPSRVRGKRDL